MDKPIIERDVVLIGKNEDGNDTFDFPVTRLGNIEDGAEIKEKPGTGDYFPVIDMSDNGKMKKTSTGGILAPLNSHIGDNVKHITAEERNSWNSKAASNHSHTAASASAAGFMSAADKQKLDGIATGSNKYTHPTTSGNKHIPAGGSSGQILRWSADGTAAWGADNNTTYGTASQSANGLMSAADKKKLDGIAASANNYAHPAYTARTGVPAANQTPAFGGTFNISQPVSDASGHVTGMNSRTVKIPNTPASESAPGLMSAEDKAKLDEISNNGARAFVTTGTVKLPNPEYSETGNAIPIPVSVTIPHTVSVLLCQGIVFTNSSNVVLLGELRSAGSIGGHTAVELVNGSSNATITFKHNSNIEPTVFYIAFA